MAGPISLRVSVTDRCRLSCLYCTPAEGVERFDPAGILSYEEILRVVRVLRSRAGLAKVHITGGEPLDRREITRLVEMLAGEGVADLAMTTNAQRLGELAGELRRAGLSRVNISLNSLRPDAFARISGGGELSRTLAGIDAAIGAGFPAKTPVKLNMTVLRGLNGSEVADIAQFGLDRGAEVRFIELMPLGPAAAHYSEWFVPSGEVLDSLRRRFDLAPLPRRAGSSSRPFRATDRAGHSGIIGVISPCSAPFCADCRRLRLAANGDLIGCLAKPNRRSILGLLRAGPGAPALDEDGVMDAAAAVMGLKRGREGFTAVAGAACMVKVGG
ncbi:MAG: GTP 3',8-cyclase MoaA [Phycisphaerae bacterium]